MNLKQHIEEAKNTHMVHIEDMVIDGGVQGARAAIFALRDLRDMLGGNDNASKQVTVKWDGAPAVFAGEDPRDGSFFVAKKGIFNANPKIYKSHEDIKADTSGDLTKKLILAFDELSKLGIKGVIQGDFMFDQSDLKKETIDGVSYTVFHPNTIAYAVPNDSDIAKEIRSAKIGIVWHTIYNGATFETMQAEFGREIVPKLKKTKSVWMVDATMPDLSGTATLTQYTRYLTIGLAILQSTGLVAVARTPGRLISGCSLPIIPDASWQRVLTMIVVMTAGTSVIMWLGELITDRGVGNGMSILIFTSIAAGFPSQLWSIKLQKGLFAFLFVCAVGILVVAAVVFVEQAQRRIPVQYAKRMVGRQAYGGTSTYIPI